MSTNFYISGKRSITVNKTGVVETQNCDYQPWQTPTKVTHEIIESKNPVGAYKAWVMSVESKGVGEAVYAKDDHFCEGEIVGYETFYIGKEECEKVDRWVSVVTSLGYELEFYTL